jgi:amidase
MIHRPQRLIATSVFILSLLVTAAMTTPAAAQDTGANDLRDIRLGKPVTDLPELAMSTSPAGMSAGLPVGMMLIGRHWEDGTVLRAADAFQIVG